MLAIIMEDEQWFTILQPKTGPSAVEKYALTMPEAFRCLAKRMALPLDLAPYRHQPLYVGLPPSCYESMVLSLPFELSAKDIQAFCQIKIAKMMDLPVRDCQVIHYGLQEKTVYALGCSKFLLKGLQQLAHQYHLQLRAIDLTIYGVLFSLYRQQPEQLQNKAARLWVMQEEGRWRVFQQQGPMILPWRAQDFLLKDLSLEELLQQAQRALAIHPQNCFYLNTGPLLSSHSTYQVIDVSQIALLAAKGLFLRHQRATT